MAKTRITIVGCGFTGTVLGHAIKAVMPDIEIIGHDRDQAAGRRAEAAKAIDKHNWNLPSSADNAALVLICIPAEGVETTLKTIGRDLPSGAIIIDLSGMAQTSLELAQKHVPEDVTFASGKLVFHPDRVPVGTPIEAAKAEMLKSAIWTLVPRHGTSPNASDSLAGFIAQLGASPLFMDELEHDGLSLSVNALPALLSSALMLTVSKDEAWRERQWLAGAAFGEDTAKSEAALSLPKTLMAQRHAAVHWLNQAMLQLMAMRDAISDGDNTELQKLLDTAFEKRNAWLADWRKGRDDGRGEPYKPPSVLGSFLGQGLAQRLSGDRGKNNDRGKK